MSRELLQSYAAGLLSQRNVLDQMGVLRDNLMAQTVREMQLSCVPSIFIPDEKPKTATQVMLENVTTEISNLTVARLREAKYRMEHSLKDMEGVNVLTLPRFQHKRTRLAVWARHAASIERLTFTAAEGSVHWQSRMMRILDEAGIDMSSKAIDSVQSRECPDDLSKEFWQFKQIY